MPNYAEMHVDELRDEARKREISGASSMRKQELIDALEREGAGGSSGRGEGRPGETLVTQDHEEIRRWAEARNGVPATVEGTEHGDRLGVLRFDFGGDDESGRLRHVSWDEWFRTFDERRLRFIYQERLASGSQSNFFRLESPDREDA